MSRSPAFPRSRITAAALCCVLLAVGCKAADDRSPAAAAERLPVTDLMNEVARASYTPPANGRLSEDQVRMYLAVKERGILLRREAARARRAGAGQATPDVAADPATADLRATQELGQNPKEFAWVQERVLEAQGVAMTRALLRKMSAGRDQLIARMEARRDGLQDPRQKAEAERQVQDFKQGLTESQPQVSPSVQHNVELIAGFGDRLDQLQRQQADAMLGPAPPAGGASTSPAGAAGSTTNVGRPAATQQPR